MKITFYNIYKELNYNNYMFENMNASIGDDLLLPLIRLNEYCMSRSIEIGTIDKISISSSDAIVFIDMPKENDKVLIEARLSGKPMYLIIFESQMIRPESHDITYHSLFKKIFTWSDDLIESDMNKYIKINFSHDAPKEFIQKFEDKFLCCMISGNKKSNYPGELYSERIKVMDWFKKNKPDDFHLYGVGWDNYSHNNKYINYFFLKFKSISRIFLKKNLLYKGMVERKKPILEKYKFSICYENAKDIPGYITEKIFDCFFAGCIPIYLGANNVQKYIPKDCFIDKRDFHSYEELFLFMNEMSESQYFSYLNNIERFINSDEFYLFSCDYFAKTIANEVSQCQIS